jgi:hypothetical protein
MANMKELIAAASATTNPAPSTLGTVSPYTSSSDNRLTGQAAWTSQGVQALISKYGEIKRNRGRVDFNPSSPTATFTVTIWAFDRITSTWFTPDAGDSPSLACTGPTSTFIDDIGFDAWYLQISDVSTGTIQILYDTDIFQPLSNVPQIYDLSTLPGLKEWLTVRTASTVQHGGSPAGNNQGVSTWASKNGSFTYTQADTGVDATQPILKTNIQNGLPVVRTSATTGLISTDANVRAVSQNIAGQTLIFAGGWDDFNTGADINLLWQEWIGGYANQRSIIFMSKSATSQAFLFLGARRLDGESTGQIQSAEYVPPGFAIWTIVFNYATGSASARRNGVYVIPDTPVSGMSTGNTSNTAIDEADIGTPYGEGSTFDLSEFIRCNQVLSLSTIQSAENALAIIYGVDFGLSPLVSNPSNYLMVFNDEFNSGSSPDSTKWNRTYDDGRRTTPTNNELEWYLDANGTVSGGVLDIVCKHENYFDSGSSTTFPYTSSMIATWGKFTQQYGYFEMRAKTPPGVGTWPAFWLLHDSPYWEIDILEKFSQNDRVWGTTYNMGASLHQQGFWRNGTDWTTTYHKYAVEWTSTYIRWYFDDYKFFEVTDTNYIPNVPMYIIANLAIDGNNPPDMSTVFPCDFLIDYIRVYQKLS